jgi:carbon-monoxide dehydrogenase medium subunit
MEFEYSAPSDLGDAIALLGDPDARVLAGGTDLVVQMRERRREVRHVIDVKRITVLSRLEAEADGSIRIGAALNATVLSRHAAMGAFPAIVQAGQMIGSYQIQNRATLGGNICNAAPSADAAPPLICHGARAEIAGPEGRRDIPVELLFLGPGRTCLGPQEILVSIRLPRPPARSSGSYLRFTPRREMDIAVAGVGAWLHLDDVGRVIDGRVALGAVGPTPLRAPRAEASLRGERLTAALIEEAANLAVHDARPISDTRGSADYRRELIRTLAQRALQNCACALGLTESR